MTRIGDRPRYPLQNQRFDKGDARQVFELVEQTISRFVGGVFGESWGCLSYPQFSWLTSGGQNFVRVGKCILLSSVSEYGVATWSSDSTTRNAGGDWGPYICKTVLHDPARSVQSNSQIDVTAFAPTALGGGGGANGQPCWLVFRRAEAPADLDNKVFWDQAMQAEDVGADNMLIREFVEFAATATIPSANSAYGENNGWFRFAYIPSWSNTTGPNVVPIHWVHSPYLRGRQPPINAGIQMAYAPTRDTSWEFGSGPWGEKGFDPTSEYPSLSKLMHWTMLKLGQHMNPVEVREQGTQDAIEAGVIPGASRYTQTNPDGWLSIPPKGLRQLDSDVTRIDGDIAQLQAAITATQALSVDLFRTLVLNTLTALGTINARQLRTGGESYLQDSTYVTMTLTPIGSAPQRLWQLTISPVVATPVPGVTIPTCRISAINVTALHNETLVERTPWVQVYTDSGFTTPAVLPLTLGGSTPVLYARIGFLFLDKSTTIPEYREPETGFCVEVVGRPVIPD